MQTVHLAIRSESFAIVSRRFASEPDVQTIVASRCIALDRIAQEALKPTGCKHGTEKAGIRRDGTTSEPDDLIGFEPQCARRMLAAAGLGT